jgi:hypothetical protein
MRGVIVVYISSGLAFLLCFHVPCTSLSSLCIYIKHLFHYPTHHTNFLPLAYYTTYKPHSPYHHKTQSRELHHPAGATHSLTQSRSPYTSASIFASIHWSGYLYFCSQEPSMVKPVKNFLRET